MIHGGWCESITLNFIHKNIKIIYFCDICKCVKVSILCRALQPRVREYNLVGGTDNGDHSGRLF